LPQDPLLRHPARGVEVTVGTRSTSTAPRPAEGRLGAAADGAATDGGRDILRGLVARLRAREALPFLVHAPGHARFDFLETTLHGVRIIGPEARFRVRHLSTQFSPSSPSDRKITQ